MKKLFSFIAGFILLSFMFITSCTEEELAIATNDWGKLTLILNPQNDPQEEWYFSTVGSSGFASLKGVDDYPYVYQQTSNTESILTFNIGTSIKYEMTWTSSTKGNFEKYENNSKKDKGTFTIIKD